MKTKSVLLLVGLAITVTICSYFVKNADDTDPTQSETTTSAPEAELTEEEAPEAAEPSKVFERMSNEDLSEAEQMYTSLRNWTDFENYITFELGEDVDLGDVIYVEKLCLPTAGWSDENVGTSYREPYYRAAGGRLSDGVEFAEWVDSFASYSYLAHDFRDYVALNFAVSDGKIYVPYNLTQYYGGWTYTSPLTLESITTLWQSHIQLELSFTEYGIDVGSMEPEKVSFAVEMSKDEGRGWRVAGLDGGYNCPLINQFIRNQFLVKGGEPDLLTQLENYLAENPIS